jgi:hypothetical protein
VIVGFYFPHIDGSVLGIIDGPGFDSKQMLIDGYEVDATIESFETLEEAEAWAEDHNDDGEIEWTEVTGGRVYEMKYK